MFYRLEHPTKPVVFCADIPELRFEALIDPNNELGNSDKLSKVHLCVNTLTPSHVQLNVLQQVENLATHELFRNRMISGEMQTHCLWYDIHTAQVSNFCECKEKLNFF
jgi:carbonic anhydrase